MSPDRGFRQWRLRVALLALVVAALFAGCASTNTSPTAAGTSSAARTAAAQVTQAAQATRTAEPVWTDVSVLQEGTIAMGNLQLQVAITITNCTTVPIHVSYICGYVPVIVQVVPVNGQGPLWTPDTYSCAPQPAKDNQEIVPSAAYTFRYTADLGGKGFHTGDYRVTATYTWHQGTLDQAGTDPGVLYGKASGQTIVTLG